MSAIVDNAGISLSKENAGGVIIRPIPVIVVVTPPKPVRVNVIRRPS